MEGIERLKWISTTVLWSGQRAVASEAYGNPLLVRKCAGVMKVLCQDDDRRIAGKTVVLSRAQTSNQACYEAVCQTQTGRACRLADESKCREQADDAEWIAVVFPRRGLRAAVGDARD